MKKKHVKYLSLPLALFVSLSMLPGCSTTDSTTTTTSTTASAGITGITAIYNSEDMDSSWDASTATLIAMNESSYTIDGTGASFEGNVLTITDAGTYVLSGKLTDGQIVVSAGENDIVRLILNGAELSCSNNAPIYSKQSKKTIITLADGTRNTVQDGATYSYASGETEPDAAIFSKNDLTINGSGSLLVQGHNNNGIATKDDLIITGGNLTVNAINDGLRGKDSIAIKDGTFTLESGGDGLQANNAEDTDKGWISLDGGTFTITAGTDGIQAENILQINNGKVTLTTGGGSANASTTTSGESRPGWGDWQSTKADTQTEEDRVSAKGLKSGTGIIVNGGVLSIDSSDDSIHSNGEILVKAGEFTLSSGDDGIHADSKLTLDGGSINIAKSYEGLESASITMNDGTVRVTAQDDGFNAAGGNDGSSQGGRPGQNSFAADESIYIRITGGYVSVDANGDGIDANGSLYFDGGTVLVNGPTNNGNGPMDYDGTCQVTGGTLAIAGSSGMAQSPGDTSTQNSLTVYYTSTQKAGTLVTLTDESGKSLLSFAPSKDYQSIVISTPELELGKTYTLISGGTLSSQPTDGLYPSSTLSGGDKLTEITLSSAVTRITDDGSEVTSNSRGMGGQPGPGGSGRPAPDGSRQPGGNGMSPSNPPTPAQ